MSGNRLIAGVKVTLPLEASSAAIPAGFVQGAAHVTLMVVVPPNGATGSLNVAEIESLIETPAAWLAGATAVTVGAGGATPVVKCHT